MKMRENDKTKTASHHQIESTMSKSTDSQADSNAYIPKYIKQSPWYKEGQKEEVKDHSFSKHGEGFSSNTYDSKRDKWEGFEINYNDPKQLESQLKAINSAVSDEGDDDTDYELELSELGLKKTDIKNNNKQDKHEKVLRDRKDVPDYIKGIRSAYNNNQWESSTEQTGN